MLEFQNISFQYPQDKQPMMQNLSFSVEDGAFISIIGASGCGKRKYICQWQTHRKHETVQRFYAPKGFAFSMAYH